MSDAGRDGAATGPDDGVEIERSSVAPVPATSLGRQLERIGVTEAQLDDYRLDRELVPMQTLALPQQEVVCWWLLRGGVARVLREVAD